MKIIDFTKLTTLNAMAINYGIKKEFLQKVIDTTDYSTVYETLKIPKKNKFKGYRTVYKADSYLADFHKNILTSIDNFLLETNINDYIHACAHGFIKGKTTLSNAKVHLNKKELLQVDIKSFFKSIPTNGIVKVFEKLGFTHQMAILMARLCSINDVIEEGLNTSPMLANLYFYEMDEKLYALAIKYQCAYTRYADDMTFSSNDVVMKETDLLKNIIEVLGAEGLFLNGKTRYSKNGQSQYVTGLSISNNERPRIPKKVKRQLRQEFHFIKKHGFDSHFSFKGEDIEKGFKRINGWIDYILSVEPEVGTELRKEYGTFK